MAGARTREGAESTRGPATHLTTVAHEMRTPLTAMKATIALLLEQPVSEATRQELLTICERNTGYLLKLVNGLLELSRIEGTSAPSVEAVALAEIAKETVESLSVLAAQQNVVVTAWVPRHLEVAAEHNGVRQVLANLVGNAVKFAPGGHVDLSAERRNGTVYLRVSDNGPGIPSERLATLFDRYTSTGRCMAQTGTGLGLAITKALVTRFGGRIWVQSEVKRGTCFTVALPAYGQAPDEPTPARSADRDVTRYAVEIARG